jgi:hypothetical protein
MKTQSLAVTSLALILVLSACHTPPDKAALGFAASTTTLVNTARMAFNDYANECRCVTESDYARVEALYLKYQQVGQVAEDAFMAYVRASQPDASALQVAIDAASASASDIVSLIYSLMPQDRTDKLKTKLDGMKKGKVK